MDNFQNPTDIDKKILLCSKCGFPNKIGDTRCMFCRAVLGRKETFFTKFEIFSDRIKRLIPLIIGVVLFSTGCYLFVAAVFAGSFSKWMIAILFLIYGIFSIRFFLRGKQKKVSDLYDQRPF